MTRLSNFIKEKKDENKDVEVTEMISENRWKFTDFLKEDGKSPSGSENDDVGTGVPPEEKWKTPEQMEQDEKDKAAMQKDKDEQEIQAGIDKEEDRYNLIRSKLGRLLATPEELAELDKEKEEEEKAEIKKTEKEKKENITETALRKTLKNGDRHQSAIDQAHSMNLRHVGHGNWADSKGEVKGKIVNDKFIPVEKGDVSGEKEKIDKAVSKVKSLVKTMTFAEKQKKIEKGWDKKKEELDNKRKERLDIPIKGEDKKKASKEIISYSTKIGNKDKTLDPKINTSKQKAFTDTLYDMKKGDKKFYDKNKNFEGIDISIKNKWEPPSHLLSGKVPVREVQIFTRMINTKLISSTSPPISYFTDGGAGGAGKIQAQAGELMTMLCTSMNDEQKLKFQKSILEHLSTLNEKESIVTKDWLKSAINNSNAIHNRIKNEFKVDDASEIITHSCWDVQEDVEALGLKDYKKNKGFSSDIYLKLKLPTGKILLNEVSLKKDKNVNFLNSSTGKFKKWDTNIPEEIDVNIYADTLKKTLTSNVKKDEVQRMIQMYNTPEVKELKSMLGNKDIDTMLNGDNRESRKFILNVLKIKSSQGDEKSSKILKKIDSNSRTYSLNAINSLNTNSKLKKGMLDEIKTEFPIKSVTEKEETMAIGDMSVDPKVVKKIFGTDKWDEIQEHLIAVTDKEPPYLAYKIKGTKDMIPISTIVVREDGVGYGASFKFEMKLDPRFAKILKDTNNSLYKMLKECILRNWFLNTEFDEEDD